MRVVRVISVGVISGCVLWLVGGVVCWSILNQSPVISASLLSSHILPGLASLMEDLEASQPDKVVRSMTL